MATVLVGYDGSPASAAADGTALARAAGWDAESLVRRCYGGEGYELARRDRRSGALRRSCRRSGRC